MSFICRDPEKIHALFIGALLQQDIESALSLYHPDAVFVSADGSLKACGHDEIEPCLRHFMTVASSMKLVGRTMHLADDTALVKMRWQLEGSQEINLAVDVIRRLEDGRWVFLIDNPYGQ